MNRRNFILGLGTAATLSGAASVTGAAISNEVAPEANFQVVAEEQLVVERNPDLDQSTNDDYSQVSVSNFDPNNAAPYPNMTVNGSTNGDLGMALATNNTAAPAFNKNSSEGGTSPYNGTDNAGTAPLEITNNGGSAQEIAINYNVGSAVDSQADADLLSQVFTFSIEGEQISPATGGSNYDGSGTVVNGTNKYDNGGSSGIPAGESRKVDFTINYSESLAQELAGLASGGDFGFSGSESAVDLLDEAVFGTPDGF